MKKQDIEKLAKQYCKKKVKVKKFSDEWQPLSIAEMTEFAEIVVNKISSKPMLSNSFAELFKAIEKIDTGHYGSAKNFIERYINSANV